MTTSVLDIETIPQSAEDLEKRMPGALRNPVMPPELEKPEEPNWAEMCPDYRLKETTKKVDELKAKVEAEQDVEKKNALITKANEALAALQEVNKKRQAWIDEKRGKWTGEIEAQREKLREGVLNQRAAFIDKAALDARLSHCKLIGLRDVDANLTKFFLWEPDAKTVNTVRKWFKGLPMVNGWNEARSFRDRPLILQPYRTERDMLSAFFAEFLLMMGGEMEAPDGKCVTYYGNTFDFPYLYRRAWILGLAQRVMFLRGRYFDDRRMIDLHDRWTMGVRDERSGGLEGLCSALGGEDYKTTDGKHFWRWYQEDPIEGLCYCFSDLDKTEFAGRKMGEIR